jgi:hypothetical protein
MTARHERVWEGEREGDRVERQTRNRERRTKEAK